MSENNPNTNWSTCVRIGGVNVGPGNPTFIIAEIGGNFNGSYELALKSVDAAIEAGADAVKFQTYKAEDLVSDPKLMYTYTDLSGHKITVSQLEMFKKMEFPYEWHAPIMEYIKSRDRIFISSAADVESVDFLKSLDVPVIKISSEDLINIPVVERVAALGVPAIISTGMASEDEVEYALSIFKKHNNRNVIILQCTSQYPTPPSACKLLRMNAFRDRFHLPVGFSDHTQGSLAASLSVALGAVLIEKHFTIDRMLPGPDHAMSTDPVGFKKLVENIRLSEQMLGEFNTNYDSSEEYGRLEYRRSIVARIDLPMGTLIREEMLAYRRPGGGLKPYERGLIIGKVLNKNIPLNQCIDINDVD